MSSGRHTTEREAEFRCVIGGKRNRLSLVRRLSLSFELRGREGGRQVELWIYAEERIHRWRISGRGLGALHGSRSLAVEMEPLAVCAPFDDAPPRWDRGRCVIEAASFARVRDAVEQGPLAFNLQGERVNGDYRLERTPLSLQGRPQWLIGREACVQASQGRR